MAEIPEELRGGTRRAPRLVTPHVLGQWLLPEPRGTKYSRGQALVVGGARPTPGDVMAGATLGLLSRGATPLQALVWGKYVHAAAGDDLVMSHGRVGYLASELAGHLPRALRSLRGN